MNIREFNYHQYLAELGYTSPIVCFNDLDHGPLFARMDEEDSFYLYCLGCDFKLNPGTEFSSVVKYKIKKITKEIVDAELDGITKRLPPSPR